MYTSDVEDMLMRKLAIYEFGFRNILQLMLESLSIFRLYQTIFYYEIVKTTNTLLRKLKQIKKPSSVTVLTLSFAVLFHNNKLLLPLK